MASDIQASLSLYNNMSTTLQGIINSLNNVISAAQNVEGATAQMFDRTGIEAAQVEINRAGRELAKMQADIEANTIYQEKFNDKLRKSIDLSGSLKRTIAEIAATYLGITGVKKFFAGADEMAGINARLSMIADKEHTVKDLQDEIFASAERSRGSYQMTADIVGKLGTQAGNAFKNNNELIAFSEQLNKNLTLAGTDPEGVRSVMYNLTQAMASGVLRGQDLNAVMANAPNILAKVADYLGKDRSEIRKLATEGQLSADVIKNALLVSAEETNKAFEGMPKTLGQIGMDFKNNFTETMMPTFERFTAFINSAKVQQFSNVVIQGAVITANVIGSVIGFMIDGIEKLYNSWETLKYPIIALITIIGLYKAEVIAVNTYHAISTGGHIALATAKALLSAATRKATIAQWGYNYAVLASPIFWIPALIIGIIVLLYAVVGVINKVKGTSISATGIIVGIIATCIAFVYNLFAGFVNGVIQAGVNLVNAFITFGNFIKNVFKHPVASVKALFADLVNSIINMLKVATRAIDTVLQTDYTAGLNNLSTKVDNWKNKQLPDDYDKADYIDPEKYMLQGKDYDEVLKNWYNKGKDFAGNIKGNIQNQFFDKSKYEVPEFNVDDLGENIKDIANSAKGTKDHAKGIQNSLDKGVEIKNEDLTYLRELATQRAVNKFSFEKIEVHATNEFGDVNNISDIAGFTDVLNVGLETAIQETAEGLGAI